MLLSLLSGRSTVHTGGAVSVESGEGTSTSSGNVIAVRSANSGATGVSGMLVFSSGTASAAATAVLCTLARALRRAVAAAW